MHGATRIGLAHIAVVSFLHVVSPATAVNVQVESSGPVSMSHDDTTTPAKEAGSEAPLAGVGALSWMAPAIYHYPNFLTDQECDHLVRAVG